jgi:hypothetical protein
MSPNNKTDYETAPGNQSGKVRSLKVLAEDNGPLKQAARNPAEAARAALADVRARYPEPDERAAGRIVSEASDVREGESVE